MLFNLVFFYSIRYLFEVKNPIFVTGYGILNVEHVYECWKDMKS